MCCCFMLPPLLTILGQVLPNSWESALELLNRITDVSAVILRSEVSHVPGGKFQAYLWGKVVIAFGDFS